MTDHDANKDLSAIMVGVFQQAFDMAFHAGAENAVAAGLSAVWEKHPRAVRDVIAERLRQQSEEGFTAEHDDKYTEGELSAAAASYAEFASYSDATRLRCAGRVINGWPWAADWWKPKTRRQDLVRAGALIVAEIERLDRAAVESAIAICEACGHAIQEGEAYLPSPATPLCATCAPTYQALIDEPEGFVDDDGEPLSKEDAKLAFDAYIAAGGKPTDSMARVR